jgi:Methyltransferase domain
MLNRAARYFPILREIKKHLQVSDSILEIGSGPYGLGQFYARSFIGCDVSFFAQPTTPMSPVLATATQLPFGNRSCDAVIMSDVLEHVPPEYRRAVIREALRVARKVAIFGFPAGPQAFEYDRRLAGTYDRKQQARPAWLQEHMRYPFPTERLFEDLRSEWNVRSFGNESLDFHYSVMRKEMHRSWNYLFLILLAVMPRIVEFILRWADREPYYRRIVVMQCPNLEPQAAQS